MSPSKESPDSKKRKRSPADKTANDTKKSRANNGTAIPSKKQTTPSPDPEDDNLCPAREILQENKRKYLIAWEDNSKTGESYKPTWEPKSNANEELVAEWKEKKEKQKQKLKQEQKQKQEQKALLKPAAKPKAKKASDNPVPKRTRRVVNSSSIPTPSSPPQTTQDPPFSESVVEEPSRDPTTANEAEQNPVLGEAAGSRTAQAVEISRPAGFDPTEYDRFSTQTSTQQTAFASSSPATTHDQASSSSANGSVGDPGTPHSAAVSTPAKSGGDRVIPDSQGPSDSYIVSTQGASEPEPEHLHSSQLIPFTNKAPIQAGPPQPIFTSPVEESSSPFLVSNSILKERRREVSSKQSQSEQSELKSGLDNVLAKSGSSEHPTGVQDKDGIRTHDFAGISQAETTDSVASPSGQQSPQTESPAQSSGSNFQPAQIVPTSSYPLTTQDESIWPTTEVVQSTPFSITSDKSSSPVSAKESSQPPPRSYSLPSAANKSSSGRGSQVPPRFQSALPNPSARSSWIRRSSLDRPSESRISKFRMEKNPPRQPVSTEKDSARKTNSPSEVPGTRSPSTIPERAPPQAPPTSLRTTALTNSAMEMSPPARPVAITPSISDSSNNQINTSSFITPRLDKKEYIVPLSFDKGNIQANEYRDILDKYRTQIKDFVGTPSTADSQARDEINALLNDLQNAELHLELCTSRNPDWTPLGPLEDFARYSCEVSPKFRFLDTLLGAFRDQEKAALREKDLHVVLVACDELLSKTEIYLQGKKFYYDYPTELRKSTSENSVGRLSVTIVSTQKGSPVIRYADLIICLDHTYDKEQIKKLRGNHMTDPNHLTPVIHPVIMNTSEHIKHCIRDSVEPAERLKILGYCVYQLRDKVGKLPDSFPRISSSWNEGAAREAARFVIKSALEDGMQYVEWTLDPIGSIKHAINLEASSFSSSARSSISKSPQEGLVSLKRLRNAEAPETSKKMRMTPQPHDSTAGDITRISDSVSGLTQPQGPMAASQANKKALEALKLELEMVKVNLKDTQDRLKSSEKGKKELKQSMEGLVKRSEQQKEEISELKDQVKQATSIADLRSTEKEKLIHRLGKKNEELTELKAKWESERDANLASQDSIVAENASLRAKLEEVTAAKEKLQKEYESLQNQWEYLKTSYQSGTSTAMEQLNTINDLQTENAKLGRAASDERRKMRESHQEKRHESLKENVAKLEREKALMKKQYDNLADRYKTLSEKSQGVGMGTRAASVPRSPRIGSGSRAASPLPASRVKALKNG